MRRATRGKVEVDYFVQRENSLVVLFEGLVQIFVLVVGVVLQVLGDDQADFGTLQLVVHSHDVVERNKLVLGKKIAPSYRG